MREDNNINNFLRAAKRHSQLLHLQDYLFDKIESVILLQKITFSIFYEHREYTNQHLIAYNTSKYTNLGA